MLHSCYFIRSECAEIKDVNLNLLLPTTKQAHKQVAVVWHQPDMQQLSPHQVNQSPPYLSHLIFFLIKFI